MKDIVEKLLAIARNAEKLDAANGDEGTWMAVAQIEKDAANELERLRALSEVQSGSIKLLQDEIERLRALLREGLRPWPLAVSDHDGSNMRSWRDDWERRVRETLGE
jgi:hypothetical protein